MILDFLFILFAAGAVLGSLLVITRRNPVTSVVFLVFVFFCLSGLFLMLDAQFIAALNIILYGGAVMVLFLFVIMLLNLGYGEWTDIRGSLGRVIAGAVAVAFAIVTTRYFLAGGRPLLADDTAVASVRRTMIEKGAIGAVAEPMFNEYVLPFLLAGLLLLVAMVGAIVLSAKRTS